MIEKKSLFQNLANLLSNDTSKKWCDNFRTNIIPKIYFHYESLKKNNNLNVIDLMSQYKNRIQSHQSTLNDILPEVFALIKFMSGKILGIEHYDVQLIGGGVLHSGQVAEMKTGEGKTFVAPLAAILNSLTGQSVFVLTSNDYLASRDSEILKPLYESLGLKVSAITSDITSCEKKERYQANVIYGSYNTVVFDHLYDTLVSSIEEKMQPYFHFVIIDEIDQVLIDTARTPMIISGSLKQKTPTLYSTLVPVINNLQSIHVSFQRESRSAILTDLGWDYIISNLPKNLKNVNIFEGENIGVVNIINNLVTAKFVYISERDYVVLRNGVHLIDPLSHRIAQNQRLSNGLHQAIEALEGVEIKQDNKISASINSYGFVKKFKKVSGMSATVMYEQDEFDSIYDLSVVVIPSNQPVIREDDMSMPMYRNDIMMYNALIRILHEKPKNQPVLICTPSVDDSERLARKLDEEQIVHLILNAKNHEEEAKIISVAGNAGSITVTTGIAGRGTDIKIDEEAKEAGGLFVICVGVFESQKVETQIRGRAGRQGEPGKTINILSREDFFISRALPSDDTIVGKVTNIINFSEDLDVYSGNQTRDMVREIQDTQQRGYALSRNNEVKFSTNIDISTIPNSPGNFSYRDKILSSSSQELKQIHQYVIEKFLESKHYIQYKNKIQEKIGNISNWRTMLNKKYNEQENNTSLIRAYNKAFDEWVVNINGLRVSVNSISYGQQDPAMVFSKLTHELYIKSCNEYAYHALKNVMQSNIMKNFFNEISQNLQNLLNSKSDS